MFFTQLSFLWKVHAPANVPAHQAEQSRMIFLGGKNPTDWKHFAEGRFLFQKDKPMCTASHQRLTSLALRLLRPLNTTPAAALAHLPVRKKSLMGAFISQITILIWPQWGAGEDEECVRAESTAGRPIQPGASDLGNYPEHRLPEGRAR